MRLALSFVISSVISSLSLHAATEADVRKALAAKTGKVALPEGTYEISREIVMQPDAHDLEIIGPGVTLKAAATFRGRALLVIPRGVNIKVFGLALDGNREAVGRMSGPPPAGTQFSRFVANNGILAEGVKGLEITDIQATYIAGFVVLVNGGSQVHIHDVEVTESGGLNVQRHNNGAGGILLEEGVTDFEVTRCLFGKLRGNGIWLISDASSAPVSKGRVAENEFSILSGSAVVLRNTANVDIEQNTIKMIGFPSEEADTTDSLLPAGIAVRGKSSHLGVRNNHFEQIAGRCMAFNGLTDSEIAANECKDVLFNAVVLGGAGNKVDANHFLDVNKSKKSEPDSLHAGVYLPAGAKDNAIEANEITGSGISQRCVVGPGAAANRSTGNECSDSAVAAWLLTYRMQPVRSH
jgi:hypothetical protein